MRKSRVKAGLSKDICYHRTLVFFPTSCTTLLKWFTFIWDMRTNSCSEFIDASTLEISSTEVAGPGGFGAFMGGTCC